jgi:hypothetical protein
MRPQGRSPGVKLGGGSSPHSLSQITILGAQLSLAIVSPTPFLAASKGLGLIAGPSRTLPSVIYWVRPLGPVRLPPADGAAPDRAMTRLRIAFASLPVSVRAAPVFGRALSLRYGSDLLSLRLLFISQLGDFVLRYRPNQEVLRALPRPPTPRHRSTVTRPASCEAWAFRQAFAHPADRCRAGRAVATGYPLGDCINAGIETFPALNWARPRFLIAPRRTVPDFVHQPDTTPARGTGDICLSPDGKPSRAGKSRTSFDSSFPGFPGLSHTGVRQVFHAGALSCVLSMNVQMLRLRFGNVTSLFFTRCCRPAGCAPDVNIFAHRLFTAADASRLHL